MSPELLTVTILAAPAAILGPICLAGHLWARRQDAVIAAGLFAAHSPKTPPTGDGEPLPAPEALAKIITFPAPCTDDSERAKSA